MDAAAQRVRAGLAMLVEAGQEFLNGGAVEHQLVDLEIAGDPVAAPVIARDVDAGSTFALERPGAAPMVMNGRTMGGFVFVAGDAIEDDDALEGWIATARAFVDTLPAK